MSSLTIMSATSKLRSLALYKQKIYILFKLAEHLILGSPNLKTIAPVKVPAELF